MNAPVQQFTVDYISPSAIETWETCPRKWAFHKLDRVPKVQGPAAALGTAFHEAKEAWLTRLVPFDLSSRAGQLAHASRHLDPHPGVATIEHEFTFAYEGVTFGGKCDGHWFDAERGVAIVLDHKTTRDLGFAKLTKADLLAHPQAPIYAVRAAQLYSVDHVELRWNYVTTQGPPIARPSWHLLHVDEARATMPRWVAAAREILACVEAANDPFIQLRAKDVPAKTSGCSAFGGCQHRKSGICEVSMSMMQGESFAQILERKRLEASGASQPPAPAPPPAGPVMGAPLPLPVLQAQPAPAPATAQLDGPPINYAPPLAGISAPAPVVPHHYGSQINPPEAELPPPPVEAAPEVPPAVLPEVAEPRRGPGRPKKNKTEQAAPPPRSATIPPPPPGTTTVVVATATPEERQEVEHSALVTAIAQGLASNPAAIYMTPSEFGGRVLQCALAVEQIAKAK